MGFNSFEKRYGRALAVDGVKPTYRNITRGRYSVIATYYVVFHKADRDRVAPFLAYAGTKERERRTTVDRIERTLDQDIASMVNVGRS